MFDITAELNELVGQTISVGDRVLGKVLEMYIIQDISGKRYIFVMDTGKKIDAGSYLRAIRQLNGQKHYYPEGSEFAMRSTKAKGKYSAKPVFRSGISNIANVSYFGGNKRGGN